MLSHGIGDCEYARDEAGCAEPVDHIYLQSGLTVSGR